MEYLTLHQFTWVSFMWIALALGGLYFVLRFLDRALIKAGFLRNFQAPAKKLVHTLLLIYELLVIVILAVVFVLINPVFHGLLLLPLVVGGFQHIKNYLSGRIVQFENSFAVGKRLKIDHTQGAIARIGRLGLQLKTSSGLFFISYSQLLADGYLLISAEEIGGFYHLLISPEAGSEKPGTATQLMDLLVTAPYLDWSQKPELVPSDDNNQFNARIWVKEESHLHDLITLIKEWGFSCKILKK